MNIEQFIQPKQHPFDMLRGYRYASEKEQTLTFILQECIRNGNFEPIKTQHDYSDMVADGLLIRTNEKEYN